MSDSSALYICNKQNSLLAIGDLVAEVPGGFRRVTRQQERIGGIAFWTFKTDREGLILPYESIAPYVINVARDTTNTKPRRSKNEAEPDVDWSEYSN